MTTGSTGAVFFLGTRAHYQVLQQPESRYDAENGNSTETIYQSPTGQWKTRDDNWRCQDHRELLYEKEPSPNTGVKRRANRRPSEAALCERDSEMKPALLNHAEDNETPKSKPPRRINVLAYLAGLARRKRRKPSEVHYLQHLEGVLNACTYRESCRCLECQSSYFDCDESEDGYSSDEDYSPRFVPPPPAETHQPQDDDDDEVFVDTVPGDNASTDMLLDEPNMSTQEGVNRATREVTMMSVSSDACTETDGDDALELEVAAGTPVLLNYLLTHPITCCIQ